MHNLDVRRAKSILVTQLITLVVVAVVVWFIDPTSARDALIGGTAAALGTGVFALWVFGRYSAQEPGQILARFYAGVVIRILVIVAVFAAAIKGLQDLEPVALFGGFFVVQVLPPLLANRVAR